MPLCPQCARVSPNDANLCAYCGRPFSHSVSTGPTESKGCGYTVAVTWLALCVVALIFALTGMVKFPVSALPSLTFSFIVFVGIGIIYLIYLANRKDL